MEAVADYWRALTEWWATLPPVPDLALPAPGDPPVMLVIATVLLALGSVAMISGWVERRVSWAGLFALTLSIALFFWVWEADRDATTFLSVPEAFVEMVARIIR